MPYGFLKKEALEPRTGGFGSICIRPHPRQDDSAQDAETRTAGTGGFRKLARAARRVRQYGALMQVGGANHVQYSWYPELSSKAIKGKIEVDLTRSGAGTPAEPPTTVT